MSHEKICNSSSAYSVGPLTETNSYGIRMEILLRLKYPNGNIVIFFIAILISDKPREITI